MVGSPEVLKHFLLVIIVKGIREELSIWKPFGLGIPEPEAGGLGVWGQLGLYSEALYKLLIFLLQQNTYKDNLRKEGFILAHRLKIHIIVEKALAGTAACHTAPAQENQREMDAGAQLCPLLAQWEIPTHGAVLPTFTTTLIQSTCSLRHQGLFSRWS